MLGTRNRAHRCRSVPQILDLHGYAEAGIAFDPYRFVERVIALVNGCNIGEKRIIRRAAVQYLQGALPLVPRDLFPRLTGCRDTEKQRLLTAHSAGFENVEQNVDSVITK